jgi:hypothetical protein
VFEIVLGVRQTGLGTAAHGDLGRRQPSAQQIALRVCGISMIAFLLASYEGYFLPCAIRLASMLPAKMGSRASYRDVLLVHLKVEE